MRESFLGFRVARTLGTEADAANAASPAKATPAGCITISREHLFEVGPGTQFCTADGRQTAKIVRLREREVFYSTNGGPEIICRFDELCRFDFATGPVMWHVQSTPLGVLLTFQ
jgi:hypothetical protein